MGTILGFVIKGAIIIIGAVVLGIVLLGFHTKELIAEKISH